MQVYSPNATASKVKAAVAGASIIVYMGHGNGWPSPYTYDPNYTTKDGFGLNADLNGDGKLHRQREQVLRRALDPRPAAGAQRRRAPVPPVLRVGQPGVRQPESSLSKAKQRVDNYAAAFLAAGARAVIANGHSHDPYYIRALFTTRQTIDAYWRNAPDAHGNVDDIRLRADLRLHVPDGSREGTGNYYRSIAGQDVAADPGRHGRPVRRHLRRPGEHGRPRQRDSPATDGAPVYGSVDAAAQAGHRPVTTPGGIRQGAGSRRSRQRTSRSTGPPIYRIHSGGRRAAG